MSDAAGIPPPKATAPLPILPRILRGELAAIYVGMSVAKLREEAAAGRAPQPVQMTEGVKGWDVRDLDSWVEARKAAQTARPNKWDRVLG